MTETQLEELSSSECRELLASHHFGRVGFVDQVGVLPMIIPVNYLLHGGRVVFRTDTGSKLSAAVHGAPVAFEVDGIDEERRIGWSVVIRGHLEEVTDAASLEQLRSTPLNVWAPGAKAHYLRVTVSQMSGRRISVAKLPDNWLG
ncbi:MAG TPA: pyridoxamine 5'-phosphate oxidase family protein [Propionibacteriaceae bacterium]